MARTWQSRVARPNTGPLPAKCTVSPYKHSIYTVRLHITYLLIRTVQLVVAPWAGGRQLPRLSALYWPSVFTRVTVRISYTSS
jgi:hypothetical protein